MQRVSQNQLVSLYERLILEVRNENNEIKAIQEPLSHESAANIDHSLSTQTREQTNRVLDELNNVESKMEDERNRILLQKERHNSDMPSRISRLRDAVKQLPCDSMGIQALINKFSGSIGRQLLKEGKECLERLKEAESLLEKARELEQATEERSDAALSIGYGSGSY
jgi:hypothetical protein